LATSFIYYMFEFDTTILLSDNTSMGTGKYNYNIVSVHYGVISQVHTIGTRTEICNKKL